MIENPNNDNDNNNNNNNNNLNININNNNQNNNYNSNTSNNNSSLIPKNSSKSIKSQSSKISIHSNSSISSSKKSNNNNKNNNTKTKSHSKFSKKNSSSHSNSNSNSNQKKSKFSKSFNKQNIINYLSVPNSPLNIKNTNGCEFSSQTEVINEFFYNISINHDVLMEKDKNNNNEIIYQGSSPDEVTLVSIANELGYSFIGRENGYIILNIKNYVKNKIETKKYQILQKI